MKRIIYLFITFLVLLVGYTIYQNSVERDILIPFDSDLDYKTKIVEMSGNSKYNVENLSSLVGPYELAEFIKNNDKNPQIYTPSEDNIQNKIFQANFHSHTTNSDGSFSVLEILDEANRYSLKNTRKPFYLAITDHNNMETGKQVIEILQANPEKYKNLKIIIGMEVFSVMPRKRNIMRTPLDVHLVCLAFNPYDKNLNKIFKNTTGDKYNYSYRTFQSALKLLSEKGFVGIAHPARYISYVVDPLDYIDYMLFTYKKVCKNRFHFIESYYQSYSHEDPRNIEYIDIKSKNLGIYRSGSIDNHGKNFFNKK